MLDNGLASNFADKATRRSARPRPGIKDEKRDLVRRRPPAHRRVRRAAACCCSCRPRSPRPRRSSCACSTAAGNETDRVAVHERRPARRAARRCRRTGSTCRAVGRRRQRPRAVGEHDSDAAGLRQGAAGRRIPAAIVEIGLTTRRRTDRTSSSDKGRRAALPGRRHRPGVGRRGRPARLGPAPDRPRPPDADQRRRARRAAITPCSSPSSRYRIVVEYFANREADGATLGSAARPQRQTFWFRTDTIAADPDDDDAARLHRHAGRRVPVRLDPWTMMTMPDDNEKGWFGREKLRVVFNTHDVDRLFARLRQGAAPAPRGGQRRAPAGQRRQRRTRCRSPTQPASRSLATLLSPWEQALGDAVDRTARRRASTSTRHGCSTASSTFDIPLHPFMEYLLDVELRRPGRGRDSPRAAGVPPPLHDGRLRHDRRLRVVGGGHAAHRAGVRRPTRSRRCCATLGAAPAGQRRSTATCSATSSSRSACPTSHGSSCSGSRPAVADPQPAAIMIDATEPLSRSRNYPKSITDTTVPDAPTRWILEPREWLTLRAGGDAGAVAGIVYAPGDQRAFVVLAPSSRGKHVTVDLVSLAMPDLPFLDNGEQSYRPRRRHPRPRARGRRCSDGAPRRPAHVHG